ncbi:MAG: transglycosylase domain-containing protein, partial [Candidatus Saccharimonadales bacterium]
MFAYFKKDILAFNSISGANLGGSISYYDRTGSVLLWQDYKSVKRTPVTFNQISPFMKDATVAIEDKHFYSEGGFDLFAIMRSAAHDVISSGHGLQGASTITEQVVKLNKGWQDPLSIQDKVEEIGLSVVLSRDYTKQQILNAYLNIAPYGNIDYGVQAAAEDYFHTSAADLSLAQAAMLASIPQSPTSFSPYSSPVYNPDVTANYFDSNGLTARAHYILELMVQQHYITEAQAKAAESVNVLAEVQPIQSEYSNIKYPYFDLAAKQQLINTYGQSLVSSGSWKVDTTLSVPLQDLADNLVAQNAANALRNGADEEAMVAEQVKTGQVVALVGGENFNNPVDGQINYAQVNINPGSTIKPYVYSTLVNNSTNVGAGSVIYDVQQPLPGYPCTNKNTPDNGGNCLEDYDFRYPGAETLRYALAGSRNVPAVKAGLMAGLPNVQKAASAMMGVSDAYRCYQPNSDVFTDGPSQEVPCYGSAAIGDGYLHLDQTVNGLATLARLGQEVPQTYILSITDS